MQATNDKEIEIEIVRERERTREPRINDSNVHMIYLTVKCSVQSSTELTNIGPEIKETRANVALHN